MSLTDAQIEKMDAMVMEGLILLSEVSTIRENKNISNKKNSCKKCKNCKDKEPK